MKTCGMMGEVVGKAASICTLHECWPREVYSHYLEDLKELCRLPGKSRRETVDGPLEMPENPPVARAEGPPTGIDPASLEGIVVDDVQATKVGKWGSGTGLKGYIGYAYLYSSEPTSRIDFEVKAPETGRYEVRIAYRHHENRGASVPVTVKAGDTLVSKQVNMQQAAPLPNGFLAIGTVQLMKGQSCTVSISPGDGKANACADAVQLVPLKD
jgi:hypothetical protein